jgi:hypothetical protein
MTPEIIYTDQKANNTQIGVFRKAAGTFQPIVDKFNNLEGFEKLKTEELKSLLEKPKEFIINIITNGEGLPKHFGFSPDKVFDLMEKPQGTDELIQEIQNLQSTHGYIESIRYAHVLELNENNTLVIIESFRVATEIGNSLILDSEAKQDAFDKLNELVSALNSMKTVKAFTPKEFFEDVVNHWPNGQFTPNYQFLMSIK